MAVPIKNKDERFKIDNDSKANWALRKIRKLKEKINENEEFAEKEIMIIEKELSEINQWLEKENQKLEDQIDFFEGLLFDYAQILREDDPELKTHSLPFGKLMFRKQRPKWKYDDNKLLDFCKENNLDNVIQIKERVNKNNLKKFVEVSGDKAINPDTGEVIEGVNVINRPEKFKVKTN